MKKLNYLLVMPRFVANAGEWYQFPLGLPYVSSSMKLAGFNVFTLNLNNEAGDIVDLLRREIDKYNIDAVLTGGLIFEYHHIKKVLAGSKSIKNNIITIAGGGIITAAPVSGMAALEFADFGVIGEGEITICELCKALEEGGDISGIKGIIYPPPPPNREKSWMLHSERSRKDYCGFGYIAVSRLRRFRDRKGDYENRKYF